MSFRLTSPLITLASVLLVVGCGDTRTPAEPLPHEAIRVEALTAVYNRGTVAQFDLVNDSTVAARSGACASELEVLVGGDAWGRVLAYDASCDAVSITVEPGQRRRVSAPLPATLPPGTYRTFHGLGIGMFRMLYVRYSQPFEVR